MEQDQAIRSGVTASVLAHLLVLALILISTEVHPLSSATESIAVDIVAPEEVAKPAPVAEPEPKPESKTKPIVFPDLSVVSNDKPVGVSQQAAAPSQAAAPPAAAPQAAAPQAALSQTAAASQAVAPQAAAPQSAATQGAAPQAAAKPQSGQPAAASRGAAAPMATLGASASGYKQPEPDLTIKYNVMLGLPAALPDPSVSGNKSGDGFDSTASTAADIESNVIGAFRRHLKTCSKLPPAVAPSDHLMVKLRVYMKQDGRLAAEPAIGGGSANVKAISMLQSAIAALKDCQPYTMLPAERYGEWKVLDLEFRPSDFSG